MSNIRAWTRTDGNGQVSLKIAARSPDTWLWFRDSPGLQFSRAKGVPQNADAISIPAKAVRTTAKEAPGHCASHQSATPARRWIHPKLAAGFDHAARTVSPKQNGRRVAPAAGVPSRAARGGPRSLRVQPEPQNVRPDRAEGGDGPVLDVPTSISVGRYEAVEDSPVCPNILRKGEPASSTAPVPLRRACRERVSLLVIIWSIRVLAGRLRGE